MEEFEILATPNPLHMAFYLSLEDLPKAAMAVLEMMSMLSADAISEGMLAEDLTASSLSYLGYDDEARFATEVGNDLLTRRLIKIQEGTGPDGGNQYSIHREIQSQVEAYLEDDPERRQLAFDRAVELVYRTFPRISEFMTPMHHAWKAYQQSIDHVLHLNEVFRRARDSECPILGRFHFAEILASAGNYLYEQRLLESCLSVTETSASICVDLTCRDAFADPTPDPSGYEYEDAEVIALQATALTLSFAILWAEGITRVHEAETKIDVVVPLREEQLKLSLTPETLFNSRFRLSSAYNDTACHMLHTGRFEQAAALLEKVILLRADLELERPLPPLKHATPRQCLAGIRLIQGRNTEVRELIQEADGIVKKLEGPNISFWHHSAIESIQLGEYEEALRMLKEVYRDAKDIFDETTRFTRDVVYTMALANYYLGRWEDAWMQLEECLAGLENTDWPRVCIIRATYLHGLVLRALGQEEDESGQSTSSPLAELTDLLDTHLPTLQIQILNRDAVDPMALFDFVCPFYSGRVTVGLLEILHLDLQK